MQFVHISALFILTGVDMSYQTPFTKRHQHGIRTMGTKHRMDWCLAHGYVNTGKWGSTSMVAMEAVS